MLANMLLFWAGAVIGTVMLLLLIGSIRSAERGMAALSGAGKKRPKAASGLAAFAPQEPARPDRASAGSPPQSH